MVSAAAANPTDFNANNSAYLMGMTNVPMMTSARQSLATGLTSFLNPLFCRAKYYVNIPVIMLFIVDAVISPFGYNPSLYYPIG